jgi:hypothetical protein
MDMELVKNKIRPSFNFNHNLELDYNFWIHLEFIPKLKGWVTNWFQNLAPRSF